MTEALRALDRRLFESSGWFVIDAGQKKVADADSLGHALKLVDHGSAAAVVGRLAHGVAAVDVDAGGELGDAIAHEIAAWLTGRGRWHLLRPSGGGPGRWHVLCVPGSDADSLAGVVEDLRVAHGLAKVHVDHRGAGGSSDTLRPLSSPHRRTGALAPPVGTVAELRAAIDSLPRLRGRKASSRARSGRARRADRAAHDAGQVALVPMSRPRREIEARWLAWFEGRGPAPQLGGADRTRSAIDLAATCVLVRAGLDVDEAWQRILAAQGDAFERTRAKGRRWWIRYHWNWAVRSDTEWRTQIGTSRPSPDPRLSGLSEPSASDDTRQAVQAARGALTALQWRYGPRERHSVLLVAHTLLDRMLREDELAVPCPLRNLEVDTGLARGTVLKALRGLHGVLGRVVEAFDHTKADCSSHIFELDSRFPQTALSLLEPPSFTPTPPAAPAATTVGCWASLPATAHSVWRALPEDGHRTVDLQELAQTAGLTHGPTQAPSAGQSRRLGVALEELVSAGLARQSASGAWHRDRSITVLHQRRSAATHRLILNRVTQERTDYRSGVASAWHRERLAALRRNRTRQHTWWSSLTDDERARRRASRAAWYASLPQLDQATQRTRMATARQRAGEPSERSLHGVWSRQFAQSEQAERSALWQAKFDALPTPEQQQRARCLAEHRYLWGLPRQWPRGAVSHDASHRAA